MELERARRRGAIARHRAARRRAFAAAFGRCDVVVFAAGGGADGDIERKRTVDLEGSLKSIEGARLAGVRRFVQVSAIGVDDPLPDDTDDVWRAYVEAKRDADAALRASDLDWTIIRPGRLTDDPATGLVSLGPTSSAATSPAPTLPPSSPPSSTPARRPAWTSSSRRTPSGRPDRAGASARLAARAAVSPRRGPSRPRRRA